MFKCWNRRFLAGEQENFQAGEQENFQADEQKNVLAGEQTKYGEVNYEDMPAGGIKLILFKKKSKW